MKLNLDFCMDPLIIFGRVKLGRLFDKVEYRKILVFLLLLETKYIEIIQRKKTSFSERDRTRVERARRNINIFLQKKKFEKCYKALF